MRVSTKTTYHLVRDWRVQNLRSLMSVFLFDKIYTPNKRKLLEDSENMQTYSYIYS